ncbi:hypothetical protein [Mycobacterium celatum]|uniref:Uncharacterized protein n=1 Tax=Mycobacterium celatum TaxID=28045 RepID=A0A1X1RVK0_MYCCE|nr:hypothetical protein [Mycobacterium celatum]ORV18505.1 hypothetical protein AWB95_03215 [Mycobacterium celatum]PIB80800.1 hypothetical protein CQY23_00645 [Mycobacterium celatum]
MRYNPPPNWPKPPEGWVPPPDWSPDPSWPPPPKGWKLWVDDPVDSQKTKSRLERLQRSDDVEYFGNDRAWSDDSEAVAPVDQLSAEPLPAGPTEVAPEDLSVHHLGRRAAIRWDDERRYDLGTIVAVSADSGAITVKLAGLEMPVSFAREGPRGGANPRLYVWI